MSHRRAKGDAVTTHIRALIELYENARELLVELTFERGPAIDPDRMYTICLKASQIIHIFRELGPSIIESQAELAWLTQLRVQGSYPPLEIHSNYIVEACLALVGRALDLKEQTGSQDLENFCGTLITQTDRYHAAMSFSKRRTTDFSWVNLITF